MKTTFRLSSYRLMGAVACAVTLGPVVTAAGARASGGLRGPITITSNADFTGAGSSTGCACVTAGSGTAADPYVIGPWAISAPSGATHGWGIQVDNSGGRVTDSFVIRGISINYTGVPFTSALLRAGIGRRPVGLLRLGVVLHACEVEHHTRLVPDHPAVVAGRNGDHIAGTELELGAVIHSNHLVTREHVPKVGGFTAIGPCNGLHVIGPAPSRLERGLADDAISDSHELDATLVGHRSDLIRRSKALLLKLHDAAPFVQSTWTTSLRPARRDRQPNGPRRASTSRADRPHLRH